MNKAICPTITAENLHIYREQIERVEGFANRIHVDFADGVFAPTKLVKPIHAWKPEKLDVDFHVMFEEPEKELQSLMSHHPDLIIVHVESKGDIKGIINKLQAFEIRAGVALLPESNPADFADAIRLAQHVLIFGGKLGYHGGQADLNQLDKIEAIKSINSEAEIGWDGGANGENIDELMSKGIDVVNVGSYIHRAEDPEKAYDILEKKLRELDRI